MLFLAPAEIQPVIRIANYHTVAPGQSWPNRQIPDVQLILMIQGEYEYWEAGQAPLLMSPGAVLLIEPGRRHTFRCIDAQKNFVPDSLEPTWPKPLPPSARGCITGVHFEFTPLGTWAGGDYRLTIAPERVTHVTDFSYLQERFKRLAEVYNSYHPYRDLQTSTIAREIILILAGHWRQPVNAEISPRMQEMIGFIRENLPVPLTRQDLARAFRVSPEHVNWLFRKELGMTPSAVINRERVLLAYRLIHEKGHSVKEAAYAVGYTDPFYFSRVFKAIFGIPPSQIA